MSRLSLLALSIAVGLSTLVATRGVRADELAAGLKALVESKSPSVVTVRVVTKTEIRFGPQSQESENRTAVQGVVVDKDGLVLISNTTFNPPMPGGAQGLEIKVTPVEFGVIFGNEEKEYPARLVAKDSKVQIAFLQIDDLEGKEIAPIDFSKGAKPAVGSRVASVSRLGKGFDYAPFFSLGRIAAAVKKPRRAWLTAGNVGGPGSVVFSPEGQVVGVLTILESGVEDEGGGGEMGMITMMLGGGGGSGMNVFILPARNVNTLIKETRQKLAAKKGDDDEEK